jgi:DNA uptake protein ComE-like DNA-binding protein
MKQVHPLPEDLLRLARQGFPRWKREEENMRDDRKSAGESQRVWHSGPTDADQAGLGTEADQADAQSLDLNHVTEQQLGAVDALGPELRRTIVEHRVHHGHYTSWDQLEKLPGMDRQKLTALQRAARIA